MNHLEIAHYAIELFVKTFKGVTADQKEWAKINIENAFRISYGTQFNYADYAVFLALSGPYYGVLTKDYRTLKELKSDKRASRFKHSKVTRQVQLKLSKLDINTRVLILLEGSKFSKHRLNKVLRVWQPTKPVIFLG